MPEDVKIPMEILSPYIEQWLARGHTTQELMEGAQIRRSEG